MITMLKKLRRALGATKIKHTLGVFRPAFIRSCLRGEDREMRNWNRKGRPAPAPPAIKRLLLEVGISTGANAYPKMGFGRPISEMEPFAKPLEMEGT